MLMTAVPTAVTTVASVTAMLHMLAVLFFLVGRPLIVSGMTRVSALVVLAVVTVVVLVFMPHRVVVAALVRFGRGRVVMLVAGRLIAVLVHPVGITAGRPRSALSASLGVRPLHRGVRQLSGRPIELCGDLLGRRQLVQPDKRSRARHVLPNRVHRRRQV
jgi:hypothetical protein